MKQIQQYTNSPDALKLVKAAQKVWQGSREPVKISITPSSNLALKLREMLGNKIDSVFITDSDIRHIMKTHGEGEARRGQVDIVPHDFGVIPLILNEYDEICVSEPDKLGNKRLLIRKDIGDIAFIATVQRGKCKLEIKTLWKRVSGASC